MSGRVGKPNLMERVANLIKDAFHEEPRSLYDSCKNDLMTCLGEKGACLAHKHDTSSPLKLRVSSRYLVTMDFLNEFFRCLIIENGKTRPAVTIWVTRAAAAGNVFASMAPFNILLWNKIAMLIMDSQFAKYLINKFIQDDYMRGEWRSLSIDGATKIANKQMTQATATTHRDKTHKQALPDKYAKYCAITMLGISGRVCNFKMLHSEPVSYTHLTLPTILLV